MIWDGFTFTSRWSSKRPSFTMIPKKKEKNVSEIDYYDADEEDPEVIHKGLSFVTYWRTADGREMLISDMEDSHLHNAILHLERFRDEQLEELEFPNDNHIRNIQRKLDILESERLRRGLPIPLVPYKTLAYRRGEVG